MPRTDCLTHAELEAFNLGDLAETALDAVTEHLDHCPRCEAAAQALDGLSDGVIRGIRHAAPARMPSPGEATPARVGDYEIVGELGRGGMGVVYKARHARLRRLVALKMLLGGELADREERTRFRAEAEAVAQLQHPNIVQVFEAGEFDGGAGAPRPYFALELVDGSTLAAHAGGRPLPPRQAAVWLETLARAVHYAHERGIVHRDLKPSNVLLTRDGQLKLCDFGVAKRLTGSDLKTRTGMLIGTAEYMAPEQTMGKAEVGPAADIHALGAVLYALLTGRPPFQADNPLETLAQIQTQEPVPPRRLRPKLPRDLDTVCLQCLHKEPHRRYASALALADDLRRFLDGRPVLARAVGPLGRAARWAGRRPAVAGLLAALALVSAAGVGLVTWKWREADARAAAEARARGAAVEQGRREQQARRAAERLSASAFLDRGVSLCQKADVARGLLWLVRGLEVAARNEDADLERIARINLAGWRGQFVRQRAALPHAQWASVVAFSPDGRTAVTGGHDKVARLWSAATGAPVGEPMRHENPVWSAAFSRDARTLLTGTGPFPGKAGTGEARLWDAAAGRPLGSPLPQPSGVHSLFFSPGGESFWTVCPHHAQRWDARTARPLGPPLLHRGAGERAAEIFAAALSPDGKILLTSSVDGTTRLWDSATGSPRGEPGRQRARVNAAAFSPDGRLALTGSHDGTAQLWEVATGRPIGPPFGHRGHVFAVAFGPDGRTAATGSMVIERGPLGQSHREGGGEACVWDVSTYQPLGEPLPHPRTVCALAFSPDGRALLTGCVDGHARFFEASTGRLLDRPLEHEGMVRAVAFSPDGRAALTASAGGENSAAARLWELARPICHTVNQADAVRRLAFSPDGRALLTGSDDRTARLWDAGTGKALTPPLRHQGAVTGLAFLPGGRDFLTADAEAVVRVWDRATGQIRRQRQFPRGVRLATFTRDGRLGLGVTWEEPIRLWDMATGEPFGKALRNGYHDATLGDGGRLILTGGPSRNAALWEADGGRQLREWRTACKVEVVACSPDGKTVAVGGRDRFARLWDVATGQPKGPPLPHEAEGISALAFSPDGQTLLTGGADRTARLWDVATGTPLGPPLGLAHKVTALAYGPGGKLLAAGGHDGTTQIGAAPTPLGGGVERIRLWVEALTGLELDSDGATRELSPALVAQRRQRLERLGGAPPPAD